MRPRQPNIRTNNAAALEQTHPHLKAFGAFLDELNEETERGAALAAAAMLDQQLGEIISAFLVSGKSAKALLDGFNAPIGTLSARSASVAALGLVSGREHAEIEIIRRIRNEFAHGVHVSFETEKITALCKRLEMDAKPYGEMEWEPRGAFTSAAVALILNLTNRAAYVSRERLKRRDWPY